MVFWGDARWTRAQLLGEIARGHWGLCKASVTDFLSRGVWKGLDGVLAALFGGVAKVLSYLQQQHAQS